MAENQDPDPNNPRAVAHYGASLTGILSSSLERDKSILALSAGGIGLLISLLTTIGASSIESLVLYIAALISFLISVASVLTVMQRNCTFLREIIDGKNATGKDLPLSALDKVSNFSFGFAVLLSAIIGVSAAISSFNQKERGMTKKVQNQSDTEQRSFHGFPPAPANPNPGNANTGSPSPSTTSNSGNASGTGSTSGTGAANSGGESGKK